jgi:aryl-alcohol dehydrogenase-like predicted oxidoreductase
MALGTMRWGTRVSADRARELYELYRAAGGNVVDTAHIYAAWEPNGAGASERTLGQLLKHNGDRRKVVVISKGGHPAESFYPRPDRYLAPETILSDIRESLDRLEMTTIDLYFLHRDDRRVPVGEIVDAMNEAVASGGIRYFGASNWGVDRIEELNRYAAGAMGFVASQPQFSLARPNAPVPTSDPALRWLTPEDVAWHERTQFPAFCYSPAAQGYFATGGEAPKAKAAYENPISRARLLRTQQLSLKLGVSENRIALAWLLGQKFPAFPIIGTGDVPHLKDALGTAGVNLTTEQIAWLSAEK